MAGRVVLLSGPVASGKSELRDLLAHRFGFETIRTRELIKELKPRVHDTRRSYQRAGDQLDRETEYEWLAQLLAARAQGLPDDATIVVDSVRKREQLRSLRRGFGNRVTHVHITAPDEVLKSRYGKREGAGELPSYDDLRRNRTEHEIERLAQVADVVVDTSLASPEDVLVRVAAHLGLYDPNNRQLVDVLIGGQFGSEGKGHVCSYLAKEYGFLMRVGGPNAGHKVIEESSREVSTFHLLPSGTRHSEAKLIIGPGAVLNVQTLLREIADFSVEQDRLTIDPQATVITPEHIKAEAELVKAIGSTGQGVGEATAGKILGRKPPLAKLAKDERLLGPYLGETYRLLEDAFAQGQKVLLEGTQGSGLSLHHGSFPHVTSRDTTVSGCLAEAGIPPSRVRRVVVVCRTYPIRVQSPAGGTSGPMANEIDFQTISTRSGIPLEELETNERTSTTNKRRRISEFDWVLFRKSASLNGPTDVALTFADYLSIRNRDARRYEQLTPETIRFVDELERVAGAPVSLVTTRFRGRGIIDRRNW